MKHAQIATALIPKFGSQTKSMVFAKHKSPHAFQWAPSSSSCWIMKFFSCFTNNCVTKTYSSPNASNILASGQNLPGSSFVIPMAYQWTGKMDILGSMKSRHCIKHWIYKKHQYVWTDYSQLNGTHQFSEWLLGLSILPWPCVMVSRSSDRAFRSQLSPSIQVYMPCVTWSVSKRNYLYTATEKLMLFFCSAEVDVENLDLFAKSYFVMCGRISFALNPDLKPNWAWKSSVGLVKVVYSEVFFACGFFSVGWGFLGVLGCFLIQSATPGLVTCVFPFPPGNSCVTTTHLECCSNHFCTCGCVRSRQSGKKPKYLKSSLFIFQYTGCCNKG